ncbi:MAG: phosphomannose isomerase type II C-terminal cupin domain [Syntrophorhabdaceae bacterium]|nr:phosphomannose isomerase type II C-terminal cupin domain [Syntrophorhabdaceae bacterium]MDD5245416.1 phosphomannose isomerase type II C-terminal cupin domain [Syntrophorhabdaceae bacterium]
MASDVEERPWGYYKVLSDEKDHKVKRIVIYPGRRLSLQRHRLRSEHWFILSGEGIVTLGDAEIPVKAGQSIDVPRHSLHRITNSGQKELAVIEVQSGNDFSEDDIERIEDDYGRIIE